jgi:hypothetical protein
MNKCIACEHEVPYREGVETSRGEVICDECYTWFQRNRAAMGHATDPDEAAREIAENR